jgi:hypothetical protein
MLLGLYISATENRQPQEMIWMNDKLVLKLMLFFKTGQLYL